MAPDGNVAEKWPCLTVMGGEFFGPADVDAPAWRDAAAVGQERRVWVGGDASSHRQSGGRRG